MLRPVTLVSANVPTMLRIQVEKRAGDTLIILTITHSNPSSIHYVDAIDLKVNGVLRSITITQPQAEPTFNYTYNWGELDSVENATARANCNIHGWSDWALLGAGPTPAPLTGNPSLALVNLLLQIAMGLVLLVGIMFAKRGEYRKHGYTMTLIVVMNAASVVIVMGPSMGNILGALGRIPQPRSLVILLHGVIGLVAEVLGAAMIFRKFGDVRIWMRIVAALWMMSLALGLGVYTILYLF